MILLALFALVFLLSILVFTIMLRIILQGPNQAHGHWFRMQKIAKATPRAHVVIVITATGFPKVCNGRKFDLHLSSIIITSIHDRQRVARVLLVTEFDVHVSDQMIPEIVDNVHFFNATEFAEFHVHVFKEAKEIFDGLFLWDRCGGSSDGLLQFGLSNGMLVQMFDEQCLRELGFVMQATAAIGVSTSSYFEIKGTVDFVFFSAMNAGQVMSHFVIIVVVNLECAMMRIMCVC